MAGACGNLIGMTLDAIQLRVLGSLIEKEIATPENYPLSINSLVNACNQKSSREPVMELSEDQVRQALHSLEELGLVTAVRDSRVAKYEHRARTVLNLRRDETAVLCLLMLRGPQTPGELRSRADRLYAFDDLVAVQATLERLASRAVPENSTAEGTGPLTAVLPRQPGSREARYAHLLGAAGLEAHVEDEAAVGKEGGTTSERMADLEARVTSLTEALNALQARIEGLESAADRVLK